MGTTLEGKQINQTYQGLLKTTDNNEVGASAKEITDGKGNGTGVTLDNSGNVTATAFIGNGSQLTNLPVTSVNTQTGDVVLDTDDIAEGANKYYTDARVEANSAVVANTSKVGITQAQSDAIVANSAKVGITTQQVTDIQTNNNKVGITTDQANAIVSNTAKVGITTDQANAIIANTAKNSYPTDDATKLLGIEAGAEVNTVDSVNSLTGAISLGLLDLDDVGTDGNSGEVLTTDGLGNFTFQPSGGGEGSVTSVNGATGAVVLDADDISDTSTTNKFTTATNLTKLGHISVTQAVDLDTMESDISTNNAKVGITTQQASDITTNNAKNTYPSADSTKVGFISVTQAVDLDTLESDVATNNAKVGITTQQANEIAANTLKTGITAQQASDITANNAKVSMVLGTTAGTALEGNTSLLQLGTTSTTALAGDTTTISTQQASDISTNNAKVGITTSQADAIVANTAKTGITTEQADAITANTLKVGITTQQAADIVSNNAKVGITTQQASDITANNAKISFDSASSTKLGTIAEGAEVNVNADWNATTGDAQILNKPTLATVATSGSYTDLSNTPTIPTNNNQLTNGAGYITDGNTGWNNTYGFITASTTDTLTNKSGSNNQWTNDAGYINEAAQTSHTNAIGNAIDFSARVTLAGGVAEGTSGIIKNLQSIL